MTESNKNESLANRDIPAEFLKEQAANAYREIREKTGIRHPDNLDLSDHDAKLDENIKLTEAVKLAENLFLEWVKKVDGQAQKTGTPQAQLQADLAKTMFYVDAGFDDPDYLDEVAADHLGQLIEEDEGNTSPDMVRTMEQIRLAQSKVRKLISEE